MKEINGVKVVQYLDYWGNVEFEQPLEPIVEPRQEEPLSLSKFPIIKERNIQVSYHSYYKYHQYASNN